MTKEKKKRGAAHCCLGTRGAEVARTRGSVHRRASFVQGEARRRYACDTKIGKQERVLLPLDWIRACRAEFRRLRFAASSTPQGLPEARHEFGPPCSSRREPREIIDVKVTCDSRIRASNSPRGVRGSPEGVAFSRAFRLSSRSCGCRAPIEGAERRACAFARVLASRGGEDWAGARCERASCGDPRAVVMRSIDGRVAMGRRAARPAEIAVGARARAAPGAADRSGVVGDLVPVLPSSICASATRAAKISAGCSPCRRRTRSDGTSAVRIGLGAFSWRELVSPVDAGEIKQVARRIRWVRPSSMRLHVTVLGADAECRHPHAPAESVDDGRVDPGSACSSQIDQTWASLRRTSTTRGCARRSCSRW